VNLLLPSALRRISLHVLLLQILGNAVLFLCCCVWLQIPDSHLWELALSLLLGLVFAVGFLELHASILRRLRRTEETKPLWQSALLLAACFLLLYIFITACAHLRDDSMRRAGYWNSQLSPHMRTIFTFERLYSWQYECIGFLLWVVLPGLLLPFAMESASLGPAAWRSTGINALPILRRWQYWLTAIAVWWTTTRLTSALVHWTPGHSVREELASVTLRLGLAYCADALLLTLLLAVTAELLARNHAARHTVP
jgi:hypothetical protein